MQNQLLLDFNYSIIIITANFSMTYNFIRYTNLHHLNDQVSLRIFGIHED